ncbi:hypothetical protein D3C80_1839760 [compost metagenome]
MGILLNENGNVRILSSEVREKCGAYSLAGAAVVLVANGGDCNMNLVRIGFRAGRNRIEAGLQRLELLQKLLCAERNRNFLQHIDQLATPQPLLELRRVLIVEQLA